MYNIHTRTLYIRIINSNSWISNYKKCHNLHIQLYIIKHLIGLVTNMVFCIKFRNILVFCVHYFLKFTVHKQLNIVRYLLIEVRAMHASMLNRSNTFFYFFTACEVAIGNYQTIRDNKYFYKSEQFLLKFYNRFSFWLKKVIWWV